MVKKDLKPLNYERILILLQGTVRQSAKKYISLNITSILHHAKAIWTLHRNLGTEHIKKITCINRFLDSISNCCSRSKEFEPCPNSLRSFSHPTSKLSKFVSHLAFFTRARTSRSDVRTRKGYQVERLPSAPKTTWRTAEHKERV